ncbi:MAG TPA: sigma-70 family RNA polymerase sigma factor [Acidimicrobiia bacterium]|nr:sigma-70 family RNA polymerase sigma factor [Acidimicrobiia bacterium]
MLGRGDDAANREAVVEFYRANYDELFRFARLLVADGAAAEEVMQQAFVKLYDAWPRMDAQRALRFVRVSIVHLARRQDDRPPSLSLVSAEGETSTEELHQRVVDAMRQLSARQRECLVLRHYERLTDAQIADALGCSIGSVRTHLRRGMARLTGLLDERTLEVLR